MDQKHDFIVTHMRSLRLWVTPIASRRVPVKQGFGEKSGILLRKGIADKGSNSN
jgi:hypothetical protein